MRTVDIRNKELGYILYRGRLIVRYRVRSLSKLVNNDVNAVVTLLVFRERFKIH